LLIGGAGGSRDVAELRSKTARSASVEKTLFQGLLSFRAQEQGLFKVAEPETVVLAHIFRKGI